MARWNRWNPVVVEEEPTEATFVNGRWMQGVNWTLCEEDHARLREGRKCVQCMEPQETPFPERCSLCGFPMRDSQRFEYEYTYQGEKHIGPSFSVSEELERLDEQRERREWAEKHGVWVPGASSHS